MADTQEAPTQSSGLVLPGALVAMVANTVPAWAAWRLLESPSGGTVLAPDLDTWLIVVAVAALATLLGILVTWRSHRRFAVGLVCGMLLAAVAVITGLAVDLLNSGGSLTG